MHTTPHLERLTIPRYFDGRGLTDMNYMFEKPIRNHNEYFFKRQEASPFDGTIIQADDNYTPLHLQIMSQPKM